MARHDSRKEVRRLTDKPPHKCPAVPGQSNASTIVAPLRINRNLTSHAAKIAAADAACRGFTVTIVPEAVQRDVVRGTKRTIEIVEDDEDSDSDDTSVEHELSVGLIPNPKRIKV
jgi:hypothetical protein